MAEDSVLPSDFGANTLLNVMKHTVANIPFLKKLGLLNLVDIGSETTQSSYAILAPLSAGKDSITGHWEMADIITNAPMDVFVNGFSADIRLLVANAFGVKDVLLNRPYSGTKAIEDYGDEMLHSRQPILYTSADSCLQIATHTDVYSLKKLYSACAYIRRNIPKKYYLGRVIARPFAGESGKFSRLPSRKDFSISPPKKNLLESLKKQNIETIGVGKISDLFNGKGIKKSFAGKSNEEDFEILNKLIVDIDKDSYIFANFSDTDVLYGHRNDPEGYSKCLERIDKFLAKFVKNMKKEDILIITADHGNDPVLISTDHNRENVPLLIYGNSIKKDNYLGKFNGFNNIAEIVKAYFDLPNNSKLYNKIIK